jgi:hypothetical protein
MMNIDELDSEGRKVCEWCFLPKGDLAAGGCMLPHKIAVETFESDALATANRNLGWCCTQGPSPLPCALLPSKILQRQPRYHKISHNPMAIKNLLVDLFVEAHERAPRQIVLDLDATDDPLWLGRRSGFGANRHRLGIVPAATTDCPRRGRQRRSAALRGGAGLAAGQPSSGIGADRGRFTPQPASRAAKKIGLKARHAAPTAIGYPYSGSET